MSANKNKSKAFYYFMLDWKKQEENRGRSFVNGLRDVQSDPKFKEAWRNLSADAKLIYKEKEKNPSQYKKTNLGESLQEVLQIQTTEKLFNERMKEYISCVVKDAKTNKSVHTLKFYAIHVNYYYTYKCETSLQYCPAEIGLVEFSLENGVIRTYNKIINSEIRKGYAYAAIEHSRHTHQIPKEPDFGEKNYAQIFKEICEFLEPEKLNGRLPPLFTLFRVNGIKNSVTSVLNFLASFNKENSYNLIVYSFEELFVHLYNINLKNKIDNAEIDEVIASIYLKKDPFDYEIDLCCDYHKMGSGSNFCSTSIVQRWIFILFSHVCSLLDIHLVPGCHKPVKKSLFDDQTLIRSCAALNVNEDVSESQASSLDWNLNNSLESRSETTYQDEQVRRSVSKPILVTFHGSFNSDSINSSSTNDSRFERSELTRTASTENDESDDITVNQNNFPGIGRGAAIRRYAQKYKSSKIGPCLGNNH